jgi:hypothetical protein
MAYVDHAFSLTDEDDLVDGAMWGRPRGPPVKEIAFAAALLAFGALGVVAGLVMAAHQVGGDRSHGEMNISTHLSAHNLGSKFQLICWVLNL